jgi:hypothetical protein
MIEATGPALRKGLAIAALPLAAGIGVSLIYWPGLVTYDGLRQYDQATSGQFDDWHPPMMEWIWRCLLPLSHSPAPMLVLQLALYGAGLLGLAGWALRQRRPGLAVALCATSLLPLTAALMGEVLKDCLMAGALMLAASLALLGLREQHKALRLAALLLIVFAATLRFNAFLAGVPLVLVVAGPRCWRSWWRLGLTALLATVVLLGAMPVANRLLGAQHSDVELSLVIFDLAGITVHSGHDVFPPLGAANPVPIIRRCYSPVKWDTYSWWVDPLCPIDFDTMRKAVHAHEISPYGYLARQIVMHPLAYADHRLAHWNIATRFLVTDMVDRPVQRMSAPNDLGFTVSTGPALNSVDRTAMTVGLGPLGWPCCYIALALGLVLASGSLPQRLAIRMLAGSALLYGLGYAAFSVASELRYYLWTMIATALALVITVSDLGTFPDAARWRPALTALVPLALVVGMASAWRLLA